MSKNTIFLQQQEVKKAVFCSILQRKAIELKRQKGEGKRPQCKFFIKFYKFCTQFEWYVGIFMYL